MKRAVILLMAVFALFALGACRRTDGTDSPLSATPSIRTPEPSMTPIFATTLPAETAAAQEPTDTQEPAVTQESAVTQEPTIAPEPFVTQEPTATLEPSAEPSILSAYRYASISNSTLLVKFAYPESWVSSPSTDTITFVEPTEEGKTGARFSVTSFPYTEKQVATKRLKNHLQNRLLAIVADYNQYQLGSVDATGFVGSSGLSATYLAVKGDSYISGYVVVGYAKNGRVYCMHFCCEQEEYETFEPLIMKLCENISVIE